MIEFVCEICERIVYNFGGATRTRCSDCELGDEGREHAEQQALRELLHDTHEKGRGAPPVRDE
jgi:hypothetical protein